MAEKTKRSASKTFVWILMALLILGLGGFGIGGFGGQVSSIGSVGSTKIDVNAYARELQQELRAMQAQTGQAMTLAQARQFGVDQAVLQRIIDRTALDEEATRIGLSVGDEQVRDQILQIPSFQGLDGNFDREAYSYALDQAGLSVQDFERDIRNETARTLLQGILTGAIAAPRGFAEQLVGYIAETRSFTMARLDQADLAEPLPEPTEEDLAAYHAANEADFTLPEIKRIAYAWLSPDMLLDSIEVDDETLRGLYQDRISEFVQPERRLVERLVFNTEDAATEAKARIDSGETDFDTLVEDRNLTLQDVDLGDVARDDLGEAADAVFALEEPGVVGPLPSDLGPALYRMNGILAAQEITFEDAREQLLREGAQDRARREIADNVEPIDDLLAGGATLEELADETQLEMGEIDWYPDLNEGIAAYVEFRSLAAEVQEGDFPEIHELEDGSIVALRLEEVVPPTLQPLDEVRDRVIAGWETQETEARLMAQAEAAQARLSEGGRMESLGYELTTETDIARDGFIQGAPEALLTTVFEMEEGEVRLVEGLGTVLIVRLDGISEADMEDTETQGLLSVVERQAQQGRTQDIVQYFSSAIERRVGITLDQAAINAVHTQFP